MTPLQHAVLLRAVYIYVYVCQACTATNPAKHTHTQAADPQYFCKGLARGCLQCSALQTHTLPRRPRLCPSLWVLGYLFCGSIELWVGGLLLCVWAGRQPASQLPSAAAVCVFEIF